MVSKPMGRCGRHIVCPLFPIVWEAFLDYRVESTVITRLEKGVITRLAEKGILPANEEQFLAAGDPSWQGLRRCRERDECREKLIRLGIVEPETLSDNPR